MKDQKKRIKSTTRLFLNSTTLGISSISLGYFIFTLNGALPTIKVMTDMEGPNEGLYEGILLSCFSIGGLLGCLIALLVVKKPRSSRMIIRIIDLFTLVAIYLCSITNLWTIVAGRLLFGILLGLGGVVVSLYVKEIIPVEVYGMMSGFDKLLY